MSTPGEQVRLDVRDGRAEIVLDRPDRRNALDVPTVELLREHLGTLRESPGLRVVLLRSEGPSFCSGIDLKAVPADDSAPWLAAYFRAWLEVHVALAELPVPVVAVLHGAAVNAGAALALAADLLVAEEDALLQLGEIHQGLAAPIGIGWLARRHTPALARRIALVGDRIPAGELVRLGIAHDCVPPGQGLDGGRRLAETLAGHPVRGVTRMLAGCDAATGTGDARHYFGDLVRASGTHDEPSFAPPRLDTLAATPTGTE